MSGLQVNAHLTNFHPGSITNRKPYLARQLDDRLIWDTDFACLGQNVSS